MSTSESGAATHEAGTIDIATPTAAPALAINQAERFASLQWMNSCGPANVEAYYHNRRTRLTSSVVLRHLPLSGARAEAGVKELWTVQPGYYVERWFGEHLSQICRLEQTLDTDLLPGFVIELTKPYELFEDRSGH